MDNKKPTYKDLPLADLNRKEMNDMWIAQRRELFRRLNANGMSQSAIARRYNVKRQNVASQIKAIQTYQPE